MPRWCVAQTKPKEVDVAILNLQRQGFSTFFPQLRQHVGREVKLVAMFPRYLFVEIEPDDHDWLPINGTRGIRRLMVSQANRPSLLPVGWVEALQARGGVIDDFVDALAFARGDLLELTDGPFAGQRGPCQWTSEKRVALLLDMLGRQTTVLVEPHSLKIVEKRPDVTA